MFYQKNACLINKTHYWGIKSIAVAQRCGYEKEAVLKHDRVDCVTKKPANGVLFACTDKRQLPQLKIE